MYLHGDALANLRGGAGWIHCAFVFGFVEGVMDAGTKRAILYLLVGCLLSFSIAQGESLLAICNILYHCCTFVYLFLGQFVWMSGFLLLVLLLIVQYNFPSLCAQKDQYIAIFF